MLLTAVSTWFTWTIPEIVGSALMTGGRGRTAAVGADVAVAGFGVLGGTVVSVAVSTTLMVCPTSATASGKVPPVGPLLQVGVGVGVHTNHWSAIVDVGAGGFAAPFTTLSV
jgi:hypothetical protein